MRYIPELDETKKLVRFLFYNHVIDLHAARIKITLLEKRRSSTFDTPKEGKKGERDFLGVKKCFFQ